MTTLAAGWPAYLARLLEDIATSRIDTGVRHELLADALAPLGAAEADRAASDIEEHAYWLRQGTYASGEDTLFAASVEQAAYRTGRALADRPADVDADGW